MTRSLSFSLARLCLPALATVLLLGACKDKASSPAAPNSPAASSEAAGPREVAIARGKLEVPGGLLTLAFAQDGLIQTVPVTEGQTVQRGQLLMQLSGETTAAELSVAESELQLAQAKHQARVQRLPALKRAIALLAEAAAAGAAEPQRAEEAQQALRDAESEVAVALAETNVARSRLAQVQVQHSRLELHAPENGTVVRIAVRPGQRIAATTTAITLLPKRSLIVRAEVNESYAAQVKVGQRATVVTDGDASPITLPAARVVRISPVMGNSQLQDDAHRGPVRVVECVLEFDQAPVARVGQNVRVSFHD